MADEQPGRQGPAPFDYAAVHEFVRISKNSDAFECLVRPAVRNAMDQAPAITIKIPELRYLLEVTYSGAYEAGLRNGVESAPSLSGKYPGFAAWLREALAAATATPSKPSDEAPLTAEASPPQG